MAKRLTDHQRWLRTINETSWRETVVGHAHAHGWIVHFIPDRFHAIAKKSGVLATTKMGEKGFPDLVMVSTFSILYVELKDETNELSFAQEVWRDRIISAGGEWYCWRPRHLDEVIDRLTLDHSELPSMVDRTIDEMSSDDYRNLSSGKDESCHVSAPDADDPTKIDLPILPSVPRTSNVKTVDTMLPKSFGKPKKRGRPKKENPPSLSTSTEPCSTSITETGGTSQRANETPSSRKSTSPSNT